MSLAREVATARNRDFASLLDDLFTAAGKTAEAAPRPSIPFDYLSVAEELHSGRIKVSDEAVAAEYRLGGGDIEAELKSLLKDFAPNDPPQISEAGTVSEIGIEMLSVEPEVIATELGLDGSDPAELGRLRRAFAFKNHPDRVPPHLQQRALKRMQIANGLIDAAKRRALEKARG